jgi:hypothetical protein
LGSWGPILLLLGSLGGSFLAFGDPFGSLGVTLWSTVGPEGDSVGFWEPFGLDFESFWELLGVIWELLGRCLRIHCGFLAEKRGIVEMHEHLHKIHVFRWF